MSTSEQRATTVVQPSVLERMLRSSYFSGFATLLGLLLTVAFAFWQHWQLAVSTLLAFAGIVTASLFVNRYSRTIRNRCLEEIQQLRDSRAEAIEALHRYIHVARDCATEFVAKYEELALRSENGATTAADYQVGVQQLIRDFLKPMLEEIIRVFQPLVPLNAGLWTAIREARLDLHTQRNFFHTLMRAGAVNHDRHGTSEPVAEDEGLPRCLRQQHAIGDGILIIGKDRPPDRWRPNPNDARKEDANVMAGPIFLKTVNPPEMYMILYVNAHRDDAFDDVLKPYLKCCTDVLSMFFNMISSILLEYRENSYRDT